MDSTNSTSALDSIIDTKTQGLETAADTANDSNQGVAGGMPGEVSNDVLSGEGASSVTNEIQGVDGEVAVANNAMQVLEGTPNSNMVTSELQGCEGPPGFVHDDISTSGPAYFIGPLANPNMAVQTRYVPKDIKDPMAVHGSCGLHNLGNTCFMNAGIQCLASCAPLLKYFFEHFQLTESLRGTLTGAFYLLLCKVWSGRYSVVQPMHFKELLGMYHPQFQDYRQHDCQEFLALLLDTFHEQLNQSHTDSFPLVQSSSAQPPATSTDPHNQGHLNNEDLTEMSGSVPGTISSLDSLPSAPVDADSKLLCPETLSSEEEPGGTAGETSPRSAQSQSSSAPEGSQGRSTLKRASSSPTEAVMAALISEDSNHSTVSAHSTDSEQSSAFKKLKIEPSDGGSPSPGPALSSVLESCDPESSSAAHSPSIQTSSAASPGKGKVGLDDHPVGEAGPGAGAAEMSPPANSSIPQRKCVRLDIPSQPQVNSSLGAQVFTKPVRDGSDDSERTHHSGVVGSRKFNNTEPAVASSECLAPPSPVPSHQNDLPPMTSSPQDSSQTNPLHFYCKESKTLNTNVLVSNYTQGDVAMDSEKFAKVDNRSQVPVSKEVNLLQEALIGLEEDKVEKALIGKTLGGSGTGHMTSSPANGRDKLGNSSNLVKTVKTRNHSTILRKPTTDVNLLNNSYDYEDEVLVGYSGLVGTSLQKGSEPGPGALECGKPDLDSVAAVAEKMELTSDIVSSEVEKNVQMQALSKFKATLTKSNIREDISDKASTSESTETEDGEMEAEAESSGSVSEDEKDDEEEDESQARVGVVKDNSTLPNSARCFTVADVEAANAAWETYTARNNSVVVDTFQGQFKSTVVCSECSHVSVTYEPFMYLSLPIPHAMERQICVVFVRPHKSTVRYLVTLHKNDKVQRLRHQLQSVTSTENSDVILAEVLDNHISRLLEDNIMLRYVNDTNRTIHAFQMLPPPELPHQQPAVTTTPTDDNLPHPYPPSPSNTGNIPSPVLAPAASADISRPLTIDVGGDMNALKDGDGSSGGANPHSLSPIVNMDKVNTMLSASQERSRSLSPETGILLCQPGMEEAELAKRDSGDSQARFVEQEEDFDQAQQPPAADPMLIGTGLWDWNNREDFLHSSAHHHRNMSAPPTSPTSEHSGTFLPVDLNINADYSTEAMFPQSPSSMDVEMDPSSADFATSQMWSGVDEVGGGKGEGDGGGGACGVIDQWQTCAICLEELMDSQLLTHQNCAGIFCHTCLEMSAKHSGELSNCCPICLNPVDVSHDFVPLASGSSVKYKVRILAVPVTFRHRHSLRSSLQSGSSFQELRLVCGPRLTYVASQQAASALYTSVDRVVPFTANYTLHFTDGQGLCCSRCEFSAHCTGCEVEKEGEVTLQPGDNLTVHFTEELLTEEVEDKMHVTDDASLEHLRSTISIFDCFEAFTQSEVLDEHNPWYCPCCCRNQCAKKTMTVWRYPDNLIIHLKRFVYEDLSSTKIDNRVMFPHTNLDITKFLAGPSTSFNIYDLYSIVCHHGGANAGHYTAFSRHPMTSMWYSYNDETVTQQWPGDAEYDTSYVLFYKRQGPQIEFDLVKDIPQCEEEEEDASSFMSTNALSINNYNSPAPPASSEQPGDTVITFETEGFSVGGDNQAASTDNQSYDFYN